MCYSIVLFKNKLKKKILKKFKNKEKAESYFEKVVMKNQSIEFEKMYENGLDCFYEIGLVGPYIENNFFFKKDSLGKNVKIYSENKDFSIYKLENYKLEELIFDFNSKTKISFDDFLKLLRGIKVFSIIFKINNKIVVQVDDILSIFSLKTDVDCLRLFTKLENLIYNKELNNFILIRDFDNNQKKYIYNLLNEKGISKSYLYRSSTTHLK